MDEYDHMRELLVQAYNTLVAWHQVITNRDKDFVTGIHEQIRREQIQYLYEALFELGVEVDG